MRTSFVFWKTLSFGLLLIVSPWAQAGDRFQPEKGYTSLFNGKDFTGWRYGNQKLGAVTKTADGRFTVEDGMIVANEGRGIRNLYTLETFPKDFNVKLEFRAGLKADSGVYVRGPQLQVRDFQRRNEQRQLKKFQNDDWNELDITVRGEIVSTRFNGRKLGEKDMLVVTVEKGQPTAKLNGKSVDVQNVQISIDAFAKCLCNGELLSKAMRVPTNGPIGLQAERGKFEFRRIRIKELGQ